MVIEKNEEKEQNKIQENKKVKVEYLNGKIYD